MRYSNDRHHAQDALQETFANVFKYLHTYNGAGSFEGWLKRIAVNCSLTYHRKIKPIHFADDSEMERRSKATVPEIYGELGKEEILKLLKELPESYYMVFNLSVIEGYNHTEIGEMLGISASTSRSTLSRARARLIEIMQKKAHVYHDVHHSIQYPRQSS